MDFYLRFKKGITSLRFTKETMIRLKGLRIHFLTAMSILYLILCCLNLYLLPIFFLTVICIQIHLKTNNLYILRSAHFFVNLFTILVLNYSKCYGIDFLLIILCLCATNFVTIYCWFQNFVINLFFISIFFYSCPLYYIKIQKMFFDFISFILLSFIYAVIERNYKENWVLFNSFKRSERQFKSILNSSINPEIIIGEKGNIIYFNEASFKVFNFQNNSHDNFKNYIINSEIDEFNNTVKQVMNRSNLQKRRMFIFKDQNSTIKQTLLIENNLHFVYQALTNDECKFYKITFQNMIWKNHLKVCSLSLIDKTKKYLEFVIKKFEQSKIVEIKKYIDKKIYTGIEKNCLYRKRIRKILYHMKLLNSNRRFQVKKIYKKFNYSSKLIALIIHVIDICSVKAMNKNINLHLHHDFDFPPELTGNIQLFETVIFSILNFLVSYTSNTDIVFNVKLNDSSGIQISKCHF